MRKTVGLAAAAILAASTVGTQVATTSATGSPATPQAGDSAIDLGARAVQELLRHPVAARISTEPGEPGVEQEFVVTEAIRDRDGSTHVRMNRTYGGLPVRGGDLIVHQSASGGWEGVSQTLRAPLKLSVEPTVEETAASTSALSPSDATRSIENLGAADSAPRLVVDTFSGQPRLAFEVLTAGRQADGTPSRLATYVNAKTGHVIRREERIVTADGSGQSLYSGTVTIQVTRSGSSYQLTDATRGNSATTDMQNRTDSALCSVFGVGCSNGVAFNSPDTSFGNGNNSNRESAAVDAHYGGATTFDYFKNVHGRNGIFGNGAGAPSRVHYGTNYVNAFWDGEKMTYGDGDGVDFGPLVSLDVAGHEMSHGVTENTANLTYSGESGGLNEATSDIFGSMVEFYAANPNDPGDYFIGEEFDLANSEGFRRMDNPALDGSSHSCWSLTTQSVDVHYSSGVGNHFFYLLSEGSGSKLIGGRTHSSPTCNGSSVTGIGRTDAAKIWFKALSTYFTSGTTYAQARTATLNAATDLFGAASPQRAAVAAAWSAVNVS